MRTCYICVYVCKCVYMCVIVCFLIEFIILHALLLWINTTCSVGFLRYFHTISYYKQKSLILDIIWLTFLQCYYCSL
jgi:hypothetical protein